MTDEIDICVSRLHGLFITPILVFIIGISLLFLPNVILIPMIFPLTIPLLMIIGIAIIIIGVLLLIRDAINAFTFNLIVTNKRVYIKKGLLWKKEQDIRLECVDGINVYMSFLGISRTGTIKIYSVGQRKLAFGPVSDPQNIRTIILRTLDAKKQE